MSPLLQSSFQNLTPKGEVSPLVKWVGGKTRLLPEIVARMPRRFGQYFEPFVGGAALYLHLEPERAVLSDLNRDLIETYRTVVADPDAVLEELSDHQNNHGEEHYYETRAYWNGEHEPHMVPTPVWRAGAFIYLNKTCFNGLWRVNKSGEFNVPMGDYKNPDIRRPTALRAAAVALGRADLRIADYRTTVQEARAGDFIYFDPPYIPVSATAAFTTYNAGGFGLDQQKDLAAVAGMLVSRGCYVMLSNSDTPLAHDLYKDFRRDRVTRSGSINSDTTRRGAVGELIITGGYTPNPKKSVAK